MNRAELTFVKRNARFIIGEGNCLLSNSNSLIFLEVGCFVGTQGQCYTPLLSCHILRYLYYFQAITWDEMSLKSVS